MGGNMARRESRLFPILSAEERYPVYDRFMASGACFTSRAQFSSIGRGVRGVFGRSGWRHRYSLLKSISTLFPVIKKYASKGSNLVPTRLGKHMEDIFQMKRYYDAFQGLGNAGMEDWSQEVESLVLRRQASAYPLSPTSPPYPPPPQLLEEDTLQSAVQDRAHP